jgi:hypothetical protein
MQVAELACREAALQPRTTQKVSLDGVEEVVADKGYHCGAALERVTSYQVCSYIPERQQKGRRKWEGKAGQQEAVYANRRHVQGNYGNSLVRRRGELVERSFAHCYDTGGMRRTHPRSHNNILLSLIFRKLLGAGTPRELKNRAVALCLRLLWLFARLKSALRSDRSSDILSVPIKAKNSTTAKSFTPCRKFRTCTKGC